MPLDAAIARLPALGTAAAPNRPFDPRTRLLLEAPIARTLLRLAWPNILVMVAQASTGLIETWWVSRLGIDALAGMALVFPGFMMMQMLSAGAMGGGISSAIARALGGGRREDADALVLHAIVVNLAIGIMCSALVLAFGPALYRALGGEGASLDAALRYSDVVFAGTVLVWLMNALASVIRGTGNMLVPSLSVSAGVAVLVPLSPCLIFGIGPFPALGMAGAGLAVVTTTALTTIVLAWYAGSGRSVVRWRRARLRWVLFADILRVGAVASMVMIYEFLHLCCHCEENWFVRTCPLVNTVRRHHTAHHNPRMMTNVNMNVTFPIADWLFGTSDLRRGLFGHLFNGYEMRFVKAGLPVTVMPHASEDAGGVEAAGPTDRA